MSRVTDPWFAAGWCVAAVVWAIDHKPDGSRQTSSLRNKSWEDHFRRRMSEWFGDDDERMSPPVQALDAETIREVRARIQAESSKRGEYTVESDRTRRDISIWLSAHREERDKDRWQEIRRSIDRNTAALDSIFPGQRLTEPPELFDHEAGLSDAAREREYHIAALRESGLEGFALPRRDDPSYKAALSVWKNKRVSYHRAKARARLNDISDGDT